MATLSSDWSNMEKEMKREWGVSNFIIKKEKSDNLVYELTFPVCFAKSLTRVSLFIITYNK